jgi:thiamine-monophosphate kinase
MMSMLPGEFELIARYFAPLARGFAGARGLRDDAALIAPAPGHELVAKTDAIVAGVHFFADEAPDLVARKALRVNLSDLAAKGAVPRAYMVDLMLPRTTSEAWVAAFARGLAEDQDEYGVHLIGGDTDSTPGPVTIAVMAFGEVPAGRMIPRSGARAGDAIHASGTIGDAALGLEALRGALPYLDPTALEFLIARYRLPLPRVTLGPRLIGVASAAIDVSDGLVADLEHLCEASGLAAVIEAARVPLSSAAQAVLTQRPDLIDTVLTGGDDYEILFTAPAHARGLPGTPIGWIVAPQPNEDPVRVLSGSGRPLSFARRGWSHFS